VLATVNAEVVSRYGVSFYVRDILCISSVVSYLMVLVHVMSLIRMVYKITNILYNKFYVLNAFSTSNLIYLEMKGRDLVH